MVSDRAIEVVREAWEELKTSLDCGDKEYSSRVVWWKCTEKCTELRILLI